MKKNYSKWVPDNIQKCLKMYENYPKSLIINKVQSPKNVYKIPV